MKAVNSGNLSLIPWLSIPIVCTAYLLLWNRLPAELIVHWTLSGTPDTGFLMGRGQTLVWEIIGLLVILGLYSWKISKSNRNNRRNTLLRYYLAAGIMTVTCLGVALYNLKR